VTIGGQPYQVVINNAGATKTVVLVPPPQPSPPPPSPSSPPLSALRIEGPVSLVLDRITRKVTLRRASGKTTAWPPLKCFYATMTPADSVLAPGDRLTFTLEFTVPGGVAKVRYAARVQAEIGPR
jgi:hypothetical protein